MNKDEIRRIMSNFLDGYVPFHSIHLYCMHLHFLFCQSCFEMVIITSEELCDSATPLHCYCGGEYYPLHDTGFEAGVE